MDPEGIIAHWKTGRIHEDAAAMMAFDCKCFHNPEEDDTRGHIGTHYNIVAGLLNYRHHLCRCLQNVNEAIPQCRRPVLEVLLFCKSVRHISVAMSLVVERIFTGHPLVAEVISVRRLSEMR